MLNKGGDFDKTLKREFKGVWIPAEVWLSDNLCVAEKALWAEIDSFTKQGKPCFMGNEHMAKFLGVGRRTVERYISNLISLGYIKMTGFDGRKRYLESRVVLDKKNRQNGEGRQNNGGRVAKMAEQNRQNGDHTYTYTNSFTENKHTRKPPNLPPECFDEFWSIYDKPRGKKKTLELWEKLNPDVALYNIILRHIKAYTAVTEQRYRKDPERYLRHECWNDAIIDDKKRMESMEETDEKLRRARQMITPGGINEG